MKKSEKLNKLQQIINNIKPAEKLVDLMCDYFLRQHESGKSIVYTSSGVDEMIEVEK